MEIEDSVFDMQHDKENAHSMRSLAERTRRPRAALADITHQFVATPSRKIQLGRDSLLQQQSRKSGETRKKLPR